jgi:hypothetical protein
MDWLTFYFSIILSKYGSLEDEIPLLLPKVDELWLVSCALGASSWSTLILTSWSLTSPTLLLFELAVALTLLNVFELFSWHIQNTTQVNSQFQCNKLKPLSTHEIHVTTHISSMVRYISEWTFKYQNKGFILVIHLIKIYRLFHKCELKSYNKMVYSFFFLF